jgi:hypothetical protein
MPSYRFTGIYPRILFGLRVGINATVQKADGTEPRIGSTLVAAPGDLVLTAEEYDHPELDPTDTAAPAPAPADAPATAPLPAPQPDPAPTAPATDSTAPDAAVTADPTATPAE